MTRRLLVDSSALVGAFLADDQHHKDAKRVFTDARSGRWKLVTTTDVFSEVVTFVRRRAGYDKAVFVGETLLRSELVPIVPVEQKIREVAWARFMRLRIPKLSLTDCTSFEVMDRLGIKEAITFDSDFRAAGYRIVPE